MKWLAIFLTLHFFPLFCVEISPKSYIETCKLAGEDPEFFSNFKRDPHYAKAVENITFSEGEAYLRFIQKEYPELVPHFDKFRQIDSIGNPETFFFQKAGTFSPTTLRYIKMAGDIIRKFGPQLKDMHLIEIGGGTGQLCKILSELGCFASYTIADHIPCNVLTHKCLSMLGVKDVRFVNIKQKREFGAYDLAIFNYSTGTFDENCCKILEEKVLKVTPYGYAPFHAVRPFSPDLPTLESMLRILMSEGRKGDLIENFSAKFPDNQILCWKPQEEFRLTSLKDTVLLSSLDRAKASAITYDFSGGRFGDNLLAYFHAKWAARKFGLPLLYREFGYSSLLKLHTMDQPLSSFPHLDRRRSISDIMQINASTPSTLFVIPYFSESKFEYDMLNHRAEGKPYFVVDWEDPAFRQEVIECLTPLIPVSTLSVPSGYVSVALHVRRGGNHETYESGARGYPLKFPPDSYYIEQLKRIGEIFKNQPLYVYIFTDDLSPHIIAQKYAEALQNPQIVFDFGKEKRFNDETARVFHDFYSMGKFDCFIRCMSNFSILASMLGNYKVMITPTHAFFKDGKVVIDEVETRLAF